MEPGAVKELVRCWWCFQGSSACSSAVDTTQLVDVAFPQCWPSWAAWESIAMRGLKAMLSNVCSDISLSWNLKIWNMTIYWGVWLYSHDSHTSFTCFKGKRVLGNRMLILNNTEAKWRVSAVNLTEPYCTAAPSLGFLRLWKKMCNWQLTF